MSDANKALVRRYVEEVLNGGSRQAAEELVAPGHVSHVPYFGPVDRGVAANDRARLRVTFPDLRIAIDDIVAEGEKVAIRWTAHGTQLGELLGIPATGKQVRFSGMTIFRIVEGKFLESWLQRDGLSVLQQLGAGPPIQLSGRATPLPRRRARG